MRFISIISLLLSLSCARLTSFRSSQDSEERLPASLEKNSEEKRELEELEKQPPATY